MRSRQMALSSVVSSSSLVPSREARAQVRAVGREEAGVEPALGGDAGARAAPAERLSDRGDEADFAGAVAVAVPLSHLARVVGIDRLERELGVDQRHQIRGRHDLVDSPAVGAPDVHELDEADDVLAAPEVPGQIDQRVIVDALANDGVQLDRTEASGRSRIDALEHHRDREVDVVHLAEDRVVDRIEADSDAIEAGGGQRRGLRGEQRGVRGEGDLRVGDRGKHLDQLRQLRAEQRLAAGDAELPHAEAGRDPGDALDLLEAEDLVARQEREVRAEDLLRHAVAAAKVATVGDRDTEVMQRPPEAVGWRSAVGVQSIEVEVTVMHGHATPPARPSSHGAPANGG